MGLCALLPVLGIACGRLEPDNHVRRTDATARIGGGRTPHGADTTEPVPLPREGLFVTAVEYPSGYDWRRDTAHGSVIGRVLLLRLRESPGPAAFDTLLALEAGAGKAVSLDPDRHHFAGGHLYTECLTELGTVYRQDGRTVFLSKEREYVRGILAVEEDLYVLSQRLEEGGFVLRRNWKPLLKRDAGRLHGSLGDPAFGRPGALFEDRGRVCFLYESASGEWILAREESSAGAVGETVVTLPDHMNRLFDIHVIDGQTCVLCQRRLHEPVLYIGSKRHDLSTTLAVPATRIGFQFLRAGSGIRFSGALRMNWNQMLFTALWSDSKFLLAQEGRTDWLEEGIYVRRKDGRLFSAGIGGIEYDLNPLGSSLVMPQCAWTDGSSLCLALTRYGATPFLWTDGQALPLTLNGCLTSVTRQ